MLLSMLFTVTWSLSAHRLQPTISNTAGEPRLKYSVDVELSTLVNSAEIALNNAL
jgi:hypothetical protein